MLFHHRTSFYPFVIALLTVGLGALMFVTLNRTAAPTSSPEEAVSAPTESDYRARSHAVVAPFLAAYQSADTDVARLVAVEDALAALTDLTVPAAYRDVHLGLAVSLALMRDGLRGDEDALENGYAKLMRLVGDYPWLAE